MTQNVESREIEILALFGLSKALAHLDRVGEGSAARSKALLVLKGAVPGSVLKLEDALADRKGQHCTDESWRSLQRELQARRCTEVVR